MNNRYRGQVNLPEIGIEGQKKIRATSILCIGAGGLGSPALLYLTAAGVGRIGIVEFDTLDESNLHRQVIYKTDEIGKSKAQAAKQRLKELNPDVDVEIFEESLNDKNVEKIFSSYDIVIDGTDNFAAKFLINDAAVKTSKPLVYGALQGFDGQVSVFDATQGPCYRCLHPEEPQIKIKNCSEAGVIGAVAGIVGITQAMQALQLIVKDPSFTPLIGRLWNIDTRNMQTQTFKIPKKSTCPICSVNPDEIILRYSAPQYCSNTKKISIAQSINFKNAIWLDVRERDELEKLGKILNAQHFALSSLTEGNLPDLPQDKEIIIYCQRGRRSLQALAILNEKGFKNLFSLSGGYEEWQKHQ